MADERHVLVTGASSGIGSATVLHLAEKGFRVTGSVRSETKADIGATAADVAGVEVETVPLDVTDADACAQVMADLGTLHGLVDISSIYGRTATPLTGWYQGSKHALEGLSDALRMEVVKDGVHVTLVEPGGFTTNIWADLERDLANREGSRSESAYQRIGGLTSMWEPLMGEPASCAKVIAKALQTPMPRARDLVGADAKVMAAASQLTPTMVKDRNLRIAQGL
jgi:NAD(P)-dependent dehydrogenase (short-subunit alcohol dehydrogenase family)